MNISTKIARHFDSVIDSLADWRQSNDLALEQTAEELLKGEYDPLAIFNIIEALEYATIMQQNAIEQAYRDKDILLAGEIIKAVSTKYWTDKANADAPSKLAAIKRFEQEDMAESKRCG